MREVAKMVVVVKVVVLVGSKITIEQKMANSKHRSPDESHIFPRNNGCGLTTHELIDISNLRTFML